MKTEDSKQVKNNHILFIYRRMIPSNGTLDMLFRELENRGKITYRSIQEMKLTNKDLDWADLTVLGRFDSWYECKLAKRMRKAGDYLIYYLDDDLPNIPKDIECSIYYGRKDIHRFILECIEQSHAIMAPSPQLLDEYATNHRIRIRCTGAAVSPAAYQSHKGRTPVKIGFAGSMDRKDDLEMILNDALIAVKEKYGDQVSFEFFGAIPVFADELNATLIPYIPDYRAYRERMNFLSWDIGLAPMPDTPFHTCKHYNKFIEYAASAVAGIYSDCAPYDRIPERETKGRFCQNTTESWFNAICAEIDDSEEREKHRQSSSECARSLFSLEYVTDRLFDEMIPAFQQQKQTGKKETGRKPLFFLKLGNIWFRGSGYVRQNGKNAPKAIWNKAKRLISTQKT